MLYLYLIKEEHGLIKMGISVDPEKILKSLEKHIPYKLNLLFYKEVDNRFLIKKFHTCFRHEKVKGDWFYLDQKDIRMVDWLLTNPEELIKIDREVAIEKCNFLHGRECDLKTAPI